MLPHRRFRARWIPRLYGCGNPLMFRETGMVFRRTLRAAHDIAERHGPSHLIELVKHADQQWVIRTFHDGPMQVIVFRLIVGPV